MPSSLRPATAPTENSWDVKDKETVFGLRNICEKKVKKVKYANYFGLEMEKKCQRKVCSSL